MASKTPHSILPISVEIYDSNNLLLERADKIDNSNYLMMTGI